MIINAPPAPSPGAVRRAIPFHICGSATAAALVELGYLDEIRVRTLPCIKAILGYCA